MRLLALKHLQREEIELYDKALREALKADKVRVTAIDARREKRAHGDKELISYVSFMSLISTLKIKRFL